MPARRPPSWRRRWDRWRSLTPAERSLLLRFTATLPLCAALLRVFSLRHTLALLTRLRWRRHPAFIPPGYAQTVAELRHTAQVISFAAAVLPFHATCLHRSLALWWYARSRGLACDLRLGVRLSGAPFQAHAWIEYEGTVINDDPSVTARFTAVAPAGSLGSSTRFD